jgi:dynein heavy chain
LKKKDLFRIAIDFLRLEKVEIAGVKGKALSARVFKIFEEFKDEFEKFSNKKYDPLDPKCDEFDSDFVEFERFILDLDRRLSSIIGAAFDDCSNLAAIFKLMTILGNILDRPAIKQDFEPRFAQIVNMLEQDMDETKRIYDVQVNLKREHEKHELAVHRNMPEVSGGLKWCAELRERITKPMEQFKKLIDHPCVNSEQMHRVNSKFKELLELLDKFGTEIYREWCGHVGKLSNNNLEKNLINRDAKTKGISTNFDPQLIAVLKEVKYMEIMRTDAVPTEAKAIHKQNDEYRKYITSLDYTVDSYNKIIKTISPEERPLIEGELKRIDTELEKGEKQLKWNSPGIGEYIAEIKNMVSDLETRLQKSKQNLEKITALMSTWNNTSLFRRFEAKSTLLQLDDKQTRLDNRYKEIKETGQKIHDLVKVIFYFFKFEFLLFSQYSFIFF